jgi:hypothetical protein
MGLIVVLLCLFGMLLVPLLLLKVVFHLLWVLVFLPFRIAGTAVGLAARIVALFTRVLFSGLGLVLFFVGLLMSVIVLPLLPFVVVGGLIWLIAKAGRGGPVVRTV